MKVINIGDDQPIGCETCKSKEGYQFSDRIKAHFNMIYSPSGEHVHSAFGEYQPVINKAKTAYCPNCGNKLGFKINRT